MINGEIIVTAGCGGIGAEFTKVLLQHGYSVIPTTRNIEAGKSFIEEELKTADESDERSRCFPVVLNYDTEEEISNFCKLLEDREIYGLVNCAANRTFGNTEHFSEWQKHFQVDVFATSMLSIAVADKLIKADGRIINISSFYSINVPDNRVYDAGMQPSGLIYGSAKAAMNYVTKYLAVQYAPANITVNAILPGGVENKDRQTEFFQKEYKKRTPMNRMAKIKDFNEALLFFLNKGSSFCTGQLLSIDGGWGLW